MYLCQRPRGNCAELTASGFTLIEAVMYQARLQG
jgi:hypothetical protein